MKTMCVMKLLLSFFSQGVKCVVHNRNHGKWVNLHNILEQKYEIHKKNYYKHKAEVKTLEVPVVFPISAEKE